METDSDCKSSKGSSTVLGGCLPAEQSTDSTAAQLNSAPSPDAAVQPPSCYAKPSEGSDLATPEPQAAKNSCSPVMENSWGFTWPSLRQKNDSGSTSTAANPSVDDFESAALSIGNWLMFAGQTVTAKGKEFVETVKPEFQEFAEQLASDTRTFIQAHGPQLNFAPFTGEESATTPLRRVGELDETDSEYSPEQVVMPEKDSTANVTAERSTASRTDATGADGTGEMAKSGKTTRGGSETSSVKKPDQKTKTLPPYLQGMSAHFVAKYMKMRGEKWTYTADPKLTVATSKYTVDDESSSPKLSESPPPSDEVECENEVSQTWRNFTVDQYELLEFVKDRIVAKQLEQLVPSVVSEELFWKRFLFRVSQLKAEEAQLTTLLQNSQRGADNDDEELNWDEAVEPPQEGSRH